MGKLGVGYTETLLSSRFSCKSKTLENKNILIFLDSKYNIFHRRTYRKKSCITFQVQLGDHGGENHTSGKEWCVYLGHGRHPETPGSAHTAAVVNKCGHFFGDREEGCKHLSC